MIKKEIRNSQTNIADIEKIKLDVKNINQELMKDMIK